MQPTILIIPGWTNSGPEHWQTLFEQRIPNCVRVEQKDWEHPLLSDWVEAIEQYVGRYERNVILVSHSCGSIAVAHWAARKYGPVAGAMLVAPTDVDVKSIPVELANFAPIPLERFQFPAVVVASANDPWCSFERASYFARRWGANLIDAGEAGHIHAASGHGPWPFGEQVLQRLVNAASATRVASSK